MTGIKRKVFKLGDSKAVTLPSDWIQSVGLKNNGDVMIYIDNILLIVPSHITKDTIKKTKEILPKLLDVIELELGE